MKRGDYSVTPLGGGGVRIETRPLLPMGPVRLAGFTLICLVGLFGIVGGTGKGWPALIIIAFWVWGAIFGVRGKGRKPASFEVHPDTLILATGERIQRNDVARLRGVSPLTPTSVVHGNISSFVVGGNKVSRASYIEAEAKGHSYVLAGGLEEIKVNAILHEIGKVWR